MSSNNNSVFKDKDIISNLENKLDTHENILPFSKFLLVFLSLSFTVFINFADSTAASIASPYIAKSLNAERTIQWGGASLLMSNAIFTTWSGRLSDIFGRKIIIIITALIVSIFELASGFATKDYQFFIFRAFVGIGNGSLTSLSIITLSDISPLKKRAFYQGLLGGFISLGVSIGPFFMSIFVEYTEKSWRSFYCCWSPMFLLVAILNWLILPSSHSHLTNLEILQNIDYLGILTITITIIFLLIPINGGGIIYPWNSSIIIIMFIISSLSFFIFLIIEWKFSKLSIIPLRIFKNLNVSNLLFQAFLYGMCYSSSMYYFPFYFELIKQMGTIKTSSMMASLQLTSMIFSSLSGKFMEFFKSFNLIIYLGYGFWTLGNGLNLLIDIDTKIWKIILIMIIQGIGIGNTLQPTIIAIQSVSDRKDRALILSVRNVLRALGNSISISISSLIYTNSLIKSINSNEGQQLPQNLQNYIILNAYGQPDLNKFNSIELKIFQKLIMKSINNIFIFWIPLTSICLIGSLFIKDKSLDYDDENQEVEQEEDEEEEDVEVIVENISIKDKEVIKPIEK